MANSVLRREEENYLRSKSLLTDNSSRYWLRLSYRLLRARVETDLFTKRTRPPVAAGGSLTREFNVVQECEDRNAAQNKRE